MIIKNLPKSISLNKYRNTHFFKLNDLKAQYAWLVKFAIQESNEKIKPLKTPIKTNFIFNNFRKRDIDGEVISIKFFHDALVELKMLEDDDLNNISAFSVESRESKGEFYDVEIIENQNN